MKKQKPIPRIVENIDPELWRIFTGLCKTENVLVGAKLNYMIKDYLGKAKIRPK